VERPFIGIKQGRCPHGFPVIFRQSTKEGEEDWWEEIGGGVNTNKSCTTCRGRLLSRYKYFPFVKAETKSSEEPKQAPEAA
jgi:hypothetical protein